MARRNGILQTPISPELATSRPSSRTAESRALVMYVWQESFESAMVTVGALRRAGFRVDLTSATTFRCWRVLRNHRLKVVLFDVSDPDNLVLCRRLRRTWHRAILVILRGKARAAVMQAFAAGADMYVLAPFPEAELVARVDALLRRLAMSQPS